MRRYNHYENEEAIGELKYWEIRNLIKGVRSKIVKLAGVVDDKTQNDVLFNIDCISKNGNIHISKFDYRISSIDLANELKEYKITIELLIAYKRLYVLYDSLHTKITETMAIKDYDGKYHEGIGGMDWHILNMNDNPMCMEY